jgi:hypothetical protein
MAISLAMLRRGSALPRRAQSYRNMCATGQSGEAAALGQLPAAPKAAHMAFCVGAPATAVRTRWTRISRIAFADSTPGLRRRRESLSGAVGDAH